MNRHMVEIGWVAENLGSLVSADLGVASQEIIVVSPYVTLPGIQYIQQALEPGVGFTLVTRFDIMAFALGTADIEAMRTIASRKGGLVRLLPRLHAKIYARDWSSWWVGSANATGAGLQIEGRGNLEILGHLNGASSSLSRILNSIVRESVPVTRDQLERIQRYVADMEIPGYPMQEMQSEENTIWRDLVNDQQEGFMFQELPFAQTPRLFWEAFEDGDRNDYRFFMHDCFVLGVDVAISDGAGIATEDVALSFRAIPVVRSLDEFLVKPRSFGEITAWLHDRCEDRPTPYRSEIKELTARVLNWLLGLYPDRYRRERPVHSEVFVRVEDAWAPVTRDRLMKAATDP